jgi:hypothetical protein
MRRLLRDNGLSIAMFGLFVFVSYSEDHNLGFCQLSSFLTWSAEASISTTKMN